MNTTVIIIIIVAVTIGIFLIRYLINRGVDKTFDAIKNARTRSDAYNHPPQQERLADRYKDILPPPAYPTNQRQASPVSEEEFCTCGRVNRPGAVFCAYCGKSIHKINRNPSKSITL